MFSPWWVWLAGLAVLVAWLALTRSGRQTWSLVRVGVDSIPRRLGSSIVVVVGIAGVVGVLVAILSIGAGFERAVKQTGTDDTVLVLSAGAQSEVTSLFDGETASLVSQAPEVLKNRDGQPIASAEQLLIASMPKRRTGLDANVALRGVGAHVWDLRPQIKITAGRKFMPGLRELNVGKGADKQFRGLGIGSTVQFNGQSWSVVGTFDSGDAYNSEMWADADVVSSTYRRAGSVASLTVRLTDAAAFGAFEAEILGDPRLKVNVQTTRHFYNRQSESFARMIKLVGATIGAIMGLGAVFGALNATYTAIGSRVREIATLRAVGFSAAPVVVAILLETMMLATLGGAVGATVAWLVFDGITTSTAGDLGQVVFAFDVSPDLLWNGLQCALAIGLVGGLFPAIRAARMPIVSGLRAL